MNAMDLIRGVSVFAGVDDSQLGAVADACRKQSFRAGQYLFQRSDPRDQLLIIGSGKVEVLGHLGDETVTVARLGDGDFIGAGGLGGLAHAFSCRAIVDTDILVWRGEDMNAFFRREPEAARAVLAQMARPIQPHPRTSDAGPSRRATVIDGAGPERLEHDLLGDRAVPADA